MGYDSELLWYATACIGLAYAALWCVREGWRRPVATTKPSAVGSDASIDDSADPDTTRLPFTPEGKYEAAPCAHHSASENSRPETGFEGTAARNFAAVVNSLWRCGFPVAMVNDRLELVLWNRAIFAATASNPGGLFVAGEHEGVLPVIGLPFAELSFSSEASRVEAVLELRRIFDEAGGDMSRPPHPQPQSRSQPHIPHIPHLQPHRHASRHPTLALELWGDAGGVVLEMKASTLVRPDGRRVVVLTGEQAPPRTLLRNEAIDAMRASLVYDDCVQDEESSVDNGGGVTGRRQRGDKLLGFSDDALSDTSDTTSQRLSSVTLRDSHDMSSMSITSAEL